MSVDNLIFDSYGTLTTPRARLTWNLILSLFTLSLPYKVYSLIGDTDEQKGVSTR